jgi:3-methylcrotonyl-CoA carboxylase alpha subunit
MIAKLIGRGDTRDEAIDELTAMLDAVEVWPVRTNAAFLFNAVASDEFGEAKIDTGFIERHLEELIPDPEPDDTVRRAAATVAILAAEEEAPLPGLAGLRLNAPPRLSAVLDDDKVGLGDDDEVAEVSGFADDERVVVFREGQAFTFRLSARGSVGAAAASSGTIVAPMPGKITAIEVSQGEKVSKGQLLLTLEAMKMEHGLTAPFDGLVSELNAKEGSQVAEAAVLAKVEPR